MFAARAVWDGAADGGRSGAWMRVETIALGLAAALCAAGSAWTAENAGAPVSFNRDVRPILSENCFACHGPDANAREAGLRLDTREGAVSRGAIVPGAPDESELVARITASDPLDVMPPPGSNLHLDASEIATLRQWIAEGAEYEAHWAFVAPEAAPPPGAGHPIDAFLEARFVAEGVVPAGAADRETQLRRVTLDLTGLPPELDAIDAFLEDTGEGAWERAVDRLLASPAYGEHMAVDWLDLARYADTHGYQEDRENHMWPWRDWVIRAYNDNMPYDQFIIEQLAGDLLPSPTQDQRLATAFNRLHRQTSEGGSVLEEFRMEYVADRVNTFGTAFMALTLDCARCHDHKYDPISIENYYEFSAFFDNIAESGMYSHFTESTPTPAMFLYADGEAETHAALKARIAALESAERGRRAAARERFAAWRSSGGAIEGAITPSAHLPLDTFDGGETPVLGADAKASLREGPEPVEGVRGQALRFSGDNGVQVEGVGDYERTDPFSVSLWLQGPGEAADEVVLHHSRAREDAGSRGWALRLSSGRPVFNLTHFWPGDSLEAASKTAIPAGTWTHLTVTYDGSSRAAGVRIYRNGTPLPLAVAHDTLGRTIRYIDRPGKAPGLGLGFRFRDVGFRDGLIDEVMLFDRELSPLEALALAEGHADVEDAAESAPDLHFEHYLLREDAAFAEHLAELRAARAAENEFAAGLRSISVMAELPEETPTHVRERGDYAALGERVAASTPEAILAFPEGRPRNRLGLAEWLTDPAHPLTARVAVNRAWLHFFGRGLVETAEDFGNQGSLPDHPELLDWLAVWFRESGWDRKALHRLIVTSSAYRRDSMGGAALMEQDPENVLLARGPRKRLRAESIRDQALAASGLLTPEMGGPSVKPYQPEGIWEDASNTPYVQDTGDALYRRSLYMFWKRTAPPPSMLTFDAGAREVCTPKRESTATPLQALVLLNDPAYVEAARVMAAGLMEAHGAPSARAEAAFRSLTGRRPDAAEMAILRRAYEEQYRHYAADLESARAFLSVGEAPYPEGQDPARVAALAAVIQAILNHHEFQVSL